jgi:hypothetical protein
MAGDDLTFTIGAREIYDRLVTMEANLTQALAETEGDHAEFKTELSDHESRLRTLEKLVWGIPASLVVAVAAIILKL